MTKLLGNKPDLLAFGFDEGRSWRYDFLEQFNIIYKDRDKGKRELTDFPAYRKFFRKTVSDFRFPILAKNKFEADDLIHVAINLIDHGEVCIMSGDSDLQQKLVSTDDKEVFILNPLIKDGFPLLRTIYQPKKQEVDDDFFAEVAPTKFIETVGNAKVVDPAGGLYVKIISGDSTDTIPSAFKYNDYGKERTVGERRAENFHHGLEHTPKLVDIINLFHSREARVELAQRIISFAKLKAFDRISEFEKGLLRNIRCILLDDVVYEPSMYSGLKETVRELLRTPSLGTDLVKIFHGTEFDITTHYYRY